MAEHLIRLRASWTWRPRDAAEAAPARIDLPTIWPAGPAGPILLMRGFQGPRLAPGRERARLRLEDVAGLRSVRLNGDELARTGAGTAALVLELEGRLRARNELVLEVDRAEAADRGAGSRTWGAIALEIVADETGGPIAPRRSIGDDGCPGV